MNSSRREPLFAIVYRLSCKQCILNIEMYRKRSHCMPSKWSCNEDVQMITYCVIVNVYICVKCVWMSLPGGAWCGMVSSLVVSWLGELGCWGKHCFSQSVGCSLKQFPCLDRLDVRWNCWFEHGNSVACLPEESCELFKMHGWVRHQGFPVLTYLLAVFSGLFSLDTWQLLQGTVICFCGSASL